MVHDNSDNHDIQRSGIRFGCSYPVNGAINGSPFEFRIYDKSGNIHSKIKLTKDVCVGLMNSIKEYLGEKED